LRVLDQTKFFENYAIRRTKSTCGCFSRPLLCETEALSRRDHESGVTSRVSGNPSGLFTKTLQEEVTTPELFKSSSSEEAIMVFVLNKDFSPVMPCSEKKARKMLEKGKAVIHRLYPLVIRLKEQITPEIEDLRLKLDPGAKTTGFAVLLEKWGREADAIILGEIIHKGSRKALDDKRQFRRTRRYRLRHRKPRWLNRANSKREGRLGPSVLSKLNQTVNAVEKLAKWLPIKSVSVENVKFDMQKMRNPEVSGVEYQQGTLAGYEAREYLLEKWGRKCAYCGATNVPLEIEHIVPRSKGGTNRIDNLTLACRPCNQEKSGKLPTEWIAELKSKKDPRAENVKKCLENVKTTLKHAAQVNATRKRIAEEMQKRFQFVELASGALTKMNRLARGLPKEHFYDACCVGETTPLKLNIKTKYVMVWTAKGRGKRGMLVRRPRKRRKPAVHRSRQKMKFGFMTGDIVRGIQPKSGLVVSGRCDSVKATGSIVVPFEGRRVAVSWRNTKLLQRGDGWEYTQRPLEYTRPKVVEKPKPPEPPTAELPKLGQISLF